MFSASDTLGPQSFGKGNFEEVGLIAIRGTVVATAIAVPINAILFFKMSDVLESLGQDPEASQHAMAWYRIFIVALPFATVFNAMWKFLAAQHVMMPLIYVSVLSCGVVLPLSLAILTDSFGFLGSSMAYVTFQSTQCILLVVYLYWKQPHVAATWPGLGLNSWKKAIQWKPLKEFASLGCGGMLSQSEWIYWEALGLIVGKLGVLELTAHTIPIQAINVLNITAFPLGTALAIRMGLNLSQTGGSKIVQHTQKVVVVAVMMTVAVFGLLTILMGLYQESIFSLFTTEPNVIALVQKLWWKVCLFNMNISIFAMLAGVGVGLGKQWSLGAVNFFFLWVFGVPAAYFATITLEGGLDAAWTCMNISYLTINVALLVLFSKADWLGIHEKIVAGEICLDPQQSQVPKRAPSVSTTACERTLLVGVV